LSDQLAAHGLRPGDSDRCAELLQAATEPVERSALFADLGSLKLLEGDIDGAMAAWRFVLSGPHDAPAAKALLNLGLLYEHLHLHERAIGVLRSVDERNVHPYNAQASMATARCQTALSRPDAAMETMARLAHVTMTDRPKASEMGEILYGLGDVAEAAGRADRAGRAWRVAAAGPTSDAQKSATRRLIHLLLAQGHDDELAELFEAEAPELADAHASPLLDRIESLFLLGHEQQAIALVQRLRGPSLATHDRFRLADVRLQIGLINEAIDELELLLSDESPEVFQRAAFSLGEIYRSYEMHDAASSMYERVASDEDPYWSPKAALALGDVKNSASDHDAAWQWWVQASASELAVVRAAAEQRLERAADLSLAPNSDSEIGIAEPVSSVAAAIEPELHAATTASSTAAVTAHEPVGPGAAPVVVALDDLEPVAAGASPVVVALGDDEPAVAGASPVVVPLDDDEPAVAGASPVVVPLDDDGPVVAGASPVVVALDDLEPVVAGASPVVVPLDDDGPVVMGASPVVVALGDDEPVVAGASPVVVPLDDDGPVVAGASPVAAGAAPVVVALGDDEPVVAGASPVVAGASPVVVPLGDDEPVVAGASPVVVALDGLEDSGLMPGVLLPDVEPAEASPSESQRPPLGKVVDDEPVSRTEVAVDEPIVVPILNLRSDPAPVPEPRNVVESAAVVEHSSAQKRKGSFEAAVEPDQSSAEQDRSGESFFARQLRGPANGSDDIEPNPYAALAPDEEHRDDQPVVRRNPYAELAPNFTDADVPASDVAAGDWESLLDDWSEAETEPAHEPPEKPKPSAFSRYT